MKMPSDQRDGATDVYRHVGRSLLTGSLFLLVLAVVCPRTAFAEPYLALRKGYACGSCHMNRTGGGMRTLLVEFHADEIFDLPNDGEGIFPEVGERFSPHINEFFSVGADFRVVDALLFQDDPGANGRVDNNEAFRRVQSNDLDITEATLYADVRLIPRRLSFYLDERVAPGRVDNREAFGILDGVLPRGAYLKVGQFFPAWGLKIQDDAAFVNSHSGFSFDRSLTGAEIGHSSDERSWFVSVSDGTANQTEPLLTASAYHNWTEAGPFSSVMAGASAAYESPGDDEFAAFTGFGGLALGSLVVLGQGVFLDTKTGGEKTQSWSAYTEADYLLGGWVNAKLAFDYLDPDTDQPEDERNRVSVGLESFLDQSVQTRLFYRVYNGPENRPNLNRDELTLEIHLFF
ncbi:MAG: hypothetical protein ACE5D3_01275 [Candidatus Binatia bacterium]